MNGNGPRKLKLRLPFRWLLGFTWGNGYGFAVRLNRPRPEPAEPRPATNSFYLRFRPDEWERVVKGADSENTSVYNFVKRTVMNATRPSRRRQEGRE